jgi:hypothetical protein
MGGESRIEACTFDILFHLLFLLLLTTTVVVVAIVAIVATTTFLSTVTLGIRIVKPLRKPSCMPYLKPRLRGG